MLPAIQVNMPGEGVDLWHLHDLVLVLHDVPSRRMLHEERIRIGEAPPGSVRDDFPASLGCGLPPGFLDNLQFYRGLRNTFQSAAEVAAAKFVLSFPKAGQVRKRGLGRRLGKRDAALKEHRQRRGSGQAPYRVFAHRGFSSFPACRRF